jgi:Family of unknown function (DUF6165)
MLQTFWRFAHRRFDLVVIACADRSRMAPVRAVRGGSDLGEKFRAISRCLMDGIVFHRQADADCMKLVAEISAGELIDKLTILQIKLDHIRDLSKRANILREFESLTATLNDATVLDSETKRLRGDLEAINRELWRIEDEIRDKERAGDFGGDFIALARAVYKTNDRRAELKRQIDLVTGSKIIEEKSYASYFREW